MYSRKRSPRQWGRTFDKQQAPGAEWVALRPIMMICNRETDYEGGGRRREPWWQKTAARKQLSSTLEDISMAARAQRWESGRRGKGGGDREVAESVAGCNGTLYYGMETGYAWVGK